MFDFDTLAPALLSPTPTCPARDPSFFTDCHVSPAPTCPASNYYFSRDNCHVFNAPTHKFNCQLMNCRVSPHFSPKSSSTKHSTNSETIKMTKMSCLGTTSTIVAISETMSYVISPFNQANTAAATHDFANWQQYLSSFHEQADGIVNISFTAAANVKTTIQESYDSPVHTSNMVSFPPAVLASSVIVVILTDDEDTTNHTATDVISDVPTTVPPYKTATNHDKANEHVFLLSPPPESPDWDEALVMDDEDTTNHAADDVIDYETTNVPKFDTAAKDDIADEATNDVTTVHTAADACDSITTKMINNEHDGDACHDETSSKKDDDGPTDDTLLDNDASGPTDDAMGVTPMDNDETVADMANVMLFNDASINDGVTPMPRDTFYGDTTTHGEHKDANDVIVTANDATTNDASMTDVKAIKTNVTTNVANIKLKTADKGINNDAVKSKIDDVTRYGDTTTIDDAILEADARNADAYDVAPDTYVKMQAAASDKEGDNLRNEFCAVPTNTIVI